MGMVEREVFGDCRRSRAVGGIRRGMVNGAGIARMSMHRGGMTRREGGREGDIEGVRARGESARPPTSIDGRARRVLRGGGREESVGGY